MVVVHRYLSQMTVIRIQWRASRTIYIYFFAFNIHVDLFVLLKWEKNTNRYKHTKTCCKNILRNSYSFDLSLSAMYFKSFRYFSHKIICIYLYAFFRIISYIKIRNTLSQNFGLWLSELMEYFWELFYFHSYTKVRNIYQNNFMGRIKP